MKKIIEYKILDQSIRDKFLKEIEIWINAGWQPYGDLIIIDKDGLEYHQAMVRYESDENDPYIAHEKRLKELSK